MDATKRFEIIQSFAEEILTPAELMHLLETKKNPIAYDGFEPSGNPHIAQGIIRAITINKMVKAGFTFKMLIADWHAMANNKFDGDLAKIQKTGEYLIEIWKSTGMDLDKVEFVSANDFMADHNYWHKVMQIARHSTVNRVIRCGQIMGRKEGEVLQASQIFYPCMQAADIFHMNVDVAQLGMDQRKVNVLAREVGEKVFGRKPVAVHHHMLMGLGTPAKGLSSEDRAIELKMSKSKPETAIFMTDSQSAIESKISKAYCPEGTLEENPIMEYYRYLIFEQNPVVTIERDTKFGGSVDFESYPALAKAFTEKTIHPMDLKKNAARYINEAVQPVRDHFAKNAKARKLQEEVFSYQITR